MELQKIIEESEFDFRMMERGKRISIYLIPGMPHKKHSYDKFIEIVCKQNSITVDELKSKCKVTLLAETRFIVAWFLVKEYGMTHARAGNVLGGKDHATIIHAIKMVENYCNVDSTFKEKFERANAVMSKIKLSNDKKIRTC